MNRLFNTQSHVIHVAFLLLIQIHNFAIIPGQLIQTMNKSIKSIIWNLSTPKTFQNLGISFWDKKLHFAINPNK